MNQNLSIITISKKNIALLLLLFMGYLVGAQDVRLHNPSFEDRPKQGIIDRYSGKRTSIKGWFDCGSIFFPRATPPDIHGGGTGFWESEMSAVQGKTYMTMVVREDDSFESVSQKLIGTLKAGQCYKFSIQLVRSNTYLSATQSSVNTMKNFTQPAVLRLYGGNSTCDNQELLAESAPVENSKWKKYEFKINPAANYDHITLEAYFVVPTAFGYNGHICLDDASMFTEIDCDADLAQLAEAEKKPRKKVVPSFKKKKKKEETVVVKTKNKKETKVDTIVYKKPKKKLLAELDRKKIKLGQLIKLEHLHFKADSSTITDVSYGVLNEVYDFLNSYQDVMIEVGGHTNNVPAHDYCDRLSTERAQAVAKYLISKGIEEERITFKGYGKRKPLGTNRTEEGRRRNQRVQIKITSLG